MTIKAIETQYLGYRFRSRLEARWAVFFDALGIRFEYEPQGYELSDGTWYLPDFYLPDIKRGVFAEVKPLTSPYGDDPDAREACRRLAMLTSCMDGDAIVLAGEPMVNVDIVRGSSRAADGGYAWWVSAGGDECVDGPYVFCVCPWCMKPGLEFDGRGARVCGYQAHHADAESALAAIQDQGFRRVDDKCYTGAHEVVMRAAHLSRSARFEHGEQPAYVR